MAVEVFTDANGCRHIRCCGECPTDCSGCPGKWQHFTISGLAAPYTNLNLEYQTAYGYNQTLVPPEGESFQDSCQVGGYSGQAMSCTLFCGGFLGEVAFIGKWTLTVITNDGVPLDGGGYAGGDMVYVQSQPVDLGKSDCPPSTWYLTSADSTDTDVGSFTLTFD